MDCQAKFAASSLVISYNLYLVITGNGEDVTSQRSLLLGLYVGSIGDVTSISDQC